MKWLVFESTLVGVRKRNKNKVNSRKSFLFFLTDPREVVECFSSPLIPYRIQSVKIKIRRNRGIFDRSVQKEGPIEKEIIQNRKKFFFQIQLFIYLLFRNFPENPISFFHSMGLYDLVLNIITLLNWQIPQQISWFGIRDSCIIWWIHFLLHFCILLYLVF